MSFRIFLLELNSKITKRLTAEYAKEPQSSQRLDLIVFFLCGLCDPDSYRGSATSAVKIFEIACSYLVDDQLLQTDLIPGTDPHKIDACRR